MIFLINLSPKFENKTPLRLEKRGNILIVNNVTLDFSNLKEGTEIPTKAINCDYVLKREDFYKDITKNAGGVIELTLAFPIELTAPQEARFPEPILVEQDGEVFLPRTYTEPEKPPQPFTQEEVIQNEQ